MISICTIFYYSSLIGIIDNEGNFNLNPGPNDILGSDSKVILIGSSDQLTHFEENTINDL